MTSPSEEQILIANPTPDPIPVEVRFDWMGDEGLWRPVAVTPAIQGGPKGMEIRLYPDEAEGYYLNVTCPQPAIFVHWRQAAAPEPMLVTLSYNEAGRLLDAGEMVEALPMPDELTAWLTEYVNLHYEPEQKKKKKGMRNRPSFMSAGEFDEMVEREKGLGRPAEPDPGSVRG